MVQCEMCGAETGSPTTVKIEGAELQVCDACSGFGTEVRTQQSSSTSTKYSTSSSSGSGRGSQSGSGSGSGSGSPATGSASSGGGRRSDMFDEVDELAPDYDDRIRRARESRDLSQADLANLLNEKASLIRKLERGEMLPSDAIQSKLERELDISLTGEAEGADDWDGGSPTEGYTLGDVVKRK